MKQKVVITGGSGIFGTAFINQFKDTYDVVVVSRKKPLSEPYDWIEGDATHEAQRIWRAYRERHSEIPLLINNHASYIGRPFINGHYNQTSLLEEMNTNLISHIVFTKIWYDDLCADKTNLQLSHNRTSVLNMGSMAGVKAYPGGQLLYGVAKSGLHGFTIQLAKELFLRGITVNCLAPNSFPQIVSTERVCDKAHELLSGYNTGKIIEMEK